MRSEPLERVEVDRAVRAERSHDRGQDASEHRGKSTPIGSRQRPGLLDSRGAVRPRSRSLARRLVLRGARARAVGARPRRHRARSAVRRRLVRPVRLRAPGRAAAGRRRGRPLARRAHDPAHRGARPRLPRGDPADRERLRGRFSDGFGGFLRDDQDRSYWPDSRSRPHSPLPGSHRRAGGLGLSTSAPAGPADAAGQRVRPE